jgi:hypothetical protein
VPIFSACGDGGGDGQRRAEHGARRLLVDFRQPDGIQAPTFSIRHLVERLGEGIGIRLLIHLPVKFMVPAEFHAASRACRGTLAPALPSSKCRNMIRPIAVWYGVM